MVENENGSPKWKWDFVGGTERMGTGTGEGGGEAGRWINKMDLQRSRLKGEGHFGALWMDFKTTGLFGAVCFEIFVAEMM